MKPAAVRLALATLTLILVLAVSSARAQSAAGPLPAPIVPVNRTIPEIVPSTYTHWPSYSYWTAAYYGYPPRIYVGLGSPANDFPYYGRPYGSPSDPWSWPAMAGYPWGMPTRYYSVLP
jgi:hypothetical protein